MPMPEKILVVEDERNIASFVSMYLKNARYHVEIARDGTEALQKADSTKPDLVGLEVCRQIRSSSDVPILMLTARDVVVARCQHQDRHVGRGADLAAHLEPDEVGLRRVGLLERLGAVACDLDVVAGVLQVHRYERGDVPLVLDHKDL